MAVERLQKLLARAGVASRRAAEQLIVRGRVKVDGKVITELGAKADLRSQSVELDGRRLMAEPLAYVLLHKPRGYVTTLHDPEGRPTVAQLVQGAGRLVPVGRLDFGTSGVLLMTNDGDFAAALMHPRRKVPKTYVAKVAGRVDDAALDGWRQSIVIDGRATQPASVRRLRWEGDKTWLEITIHEGRNRQVRRLGESTGSQVLRLARVAYAEITHEGLRPGEWRYLTVDELKSLQRSYGVPRRVRPQERGTEGRLVERTSNRRSPGRAAAIHDEDRSYPGAWARARSPERVRSTRGRGSEESVARGDLSQRRPPRGDGGTPRESPRVERGEGGAERGRRRVERGEGGAERGCRRVERGEGGAERGSRSAQRATRSRSDARSAGSAVQGSKTRDWGAAKHARATSRREPVSDSAVGEGPAPSRFGVSASVARRERSPRRGVSRKTDRRR